MYYVKCTSVHTYIPKRDGRYQKFHVMIYVRTYHAVLMKTVQALVILLEIQ